MDFTRYRWRRDSWKYSLSNRNGMTTVRYSFCFDRRTDNRELPDYPNHDEGIAGRIKDTR